MEDKKKKNVYSMLFQEMQDRLGRQEESLSRLRDENSNLNHDISQLISVISTARTTGRWEVRKIKLHCVHSIHKASFDWFKC